MWQLGIRDVSLRLCRPSLTTLSRGYQPELRPRLARQLHHPSRGTQTHPASIRFEDRRWSEGGRPAVLHRHTPGGARYFSGGALTPGDRGFPNWMDAHVHRSGLGSVLRRTVYGLVSSGETRVAVVNVDFTWMEMCDVPSRTCRVVLVLIDARGGAGVDPFQSWDDGAHPSVRLIPIVR